MARVAVTGASGLVGHALTQSLRRAGTRVIRIGRGADSDIRWDVDAGRLDASALDGVDAIVHLAGETISERWTSRRMQAIRDSRVRSTALIVRAVESMARKPRVLVSGSAIGYYGDRGDENLDEHSAPGGGFLAGVVREWEAEAQRANAFGLRVCIMRTGLVLAESGGALAKLLPPFRRGLGGPIGDARQWMSWIALRDLVRAIEFTISGDVRGAVNAVAPNPVRNEEFVRTLGAVLSRPAVVPLPAFALKLAFGDMAVETILASQCVAPTVLTNAGFQFSLPTLSDALRAELAVVTR